MLFLLRLTALTYLLSLYSISTVVLRGKTSYETSSCSWVLGKCVKNVQMVVKCSEGALWFCFIIIWDDVTVVLTSLLILISDLIIWLVEKVLNTHCRKERLEVFQGHTEIAHRFPMCSISCIPFIFYVKLQQYTAISKCKTKQKPR